MLRLTQLFLTFNYLLTPAPIDLSLNAAVLPLTPTYPTPEPVPVVLPYPKIKMRAVPDAKKPNSYITIVLNERRVYVDRVGALPISFPIAIGKRGWETPVGHWKVRNMYKNPDWTNFKTRKVVPAGPLNPLGSRWIGFWTDGKDEIGFHATRNLSSIGKAVSHGCIRMRDADVKVLYDLVTVGTSVEVIAKVAPNVPQYIIK